MSETGYKMELILFWVTLNREIMNYYFSATVYVKGTAPGFDAQFQGSMHSSRVQS